MDEKKNIWQRIIEFHIRQRTILLIIIGLGTAFFVYHIVAHLTVATNFFELYPPNHPYIKLYKQYRSMFGSANVMTMVVKVKKGDIYNTETLNKIDRITKDLLALKGVNSLQVISITHPKMKNISVGVFGVDMRPLTHPRIPQTTDEMIRFKEKVYSNEGIRGIYITPNDKGTLIHAGFWEEGVDLKNLHAEMMKLQTRETDANHEIYVTGYPMLYAWIASYSGVLSRVFIATILVTMGLLVFYFRSWIGVVLPLLSGLLSAVWGIGFAALMGFNLDPLILVVPMLLSARALSHSVQCLERYHEEFVRVGNKEKAIIQSYTYLFKPAVLSIVADGLSILVVALCPIPIMRKLAIYSSFWIISIYVGVVTLGPILVTLFPAPRLKNLSGEPETMDLFKLEEIRKITKRPGERVYMALCHALITLSQSWRKPVVGVAMVLIIVGGGYYAHFLKVGDVSAGKAILYNNHPYNVAGDIVNKEFIGSSQLIVIAEGKSKGAMSQAESLRSLEDLQLYAQGLPNVGGTVTITNIVKRLFRMFHEGDPKWAILPEESSHLSQIFFLFGAGTARGEMDRFVSTPDYTNATVTIYYRDYTNQVIRDSIARLKSYIDSHPVKQMTFRLAGGIMGILAAVNEVVEKFYWINMILIFMVTYILCLIVYRSWLSSLVLILPVIISQILSEVFMLLKGIDLNINSLPVAAVGVGVGIDYGFYILSRLSEEYHAGKDFETAVYVALTTTGKAVCFTATTLVAGTIFWAFSVIKFQAEMGLLLAFLMVFNMIGAMVFIPTQVAILGPQRTLLKYRV